MNIVPKKKQTSQSESRQDLATKSKHGGRTARSRGLTFADFGVKVPVVNNLNGTALEPDYTVVTSIRINF